MGAGRPLKFETVETLEEKINEYFESCWEEVWFTQEKREGKKVVCTEWVPALDRHGNIVKRLKERPCITGLAVFLDTSRKVLMEYEEKEEYSNTIKKAKNLCEYYAEQGTISGAIPPGAGVFILKNFGWTDKQEIESKNVNTNLNYDMTWVVETLGIEEAERLLKTGMDIDSIIELAKEKGK